MARPRRTEDQRRDAFLHSCFRRLYGLSLEEYDFLYEAQEGRCAICREPRPRRSRGKERSERRLSVDHDHRSGKVRGLLCYRCNTTLGFFERDEFKLFERLLRYANPECDAQARLLIEELKRRVIRQEV